jgi:hypothetical protein
MLLGDRLCSTDCTMSLGCLQFLYFCNQALAQERTEKHNIDEGIGVNCRTILACNLGPTKSTSGDVHAGYLLLLYRADTMLCKNTLAFFLQRFQACMLLASKMDELQYPCIPCILFNVSINPTSLCHKLACQNPSIRI